MELGDREDSGKKDQERKGLISTSNRFSVLADEEGFIRQGRRIA